MTFGALYKTRGEMMAANVRERVGVEVGVQRGDFSQEILDAGAKQLHLVDAWASLPNENKKDPAAISHGGQLENWRFVKKRFADHVQANRVMIHRGTSLALAPHFHDLDFVYIDASHEYFDVLNDLGAWAPRLNNAGCLFLHDYVNNAESKKMGFGVVRAVDDWCRFHRWEIVAVTCDDWPTVQLRPQ